MISGSMISSLFVYALVVEVLSRSRGVEAATSAPEVLRWAFYAVAVAMVFMSHVAKAFMLRGAGAGGEEQLVARLMTATVVTAALAETPAILGLVLYVVGGYYTDFYFLALISLYLLMRHFPRWGQWEQRLQRHGVGG
jgi:hypothetical protein